MGNSPGSRANNIYSPDSDKMTEARLYGSTSCQPGSLVIGAFFYIEQSFLFPDLAVKAAKSENKKRLFNVREALVSSRFKELLFTRLAGE